MIDRGYGIFININELDTASSSAPVYVLWILFIRHHSVRFTLSHCKHVCSVVACLVRCADNWRPLSIFVNFCSFCLSRQICLFFENNIQKLKAIKSRSLTGFENTFYISPDIGLLIAIYKRIQNDIMLL